MYTGILFDLNNENFLVYIVKKLKKKKKDIYILKYYIIKMENLQKILSDNKNSITLDNLVKYISKPILIIQYRYAEEDGLGGSLSIIENFDILEESLKNNEFKITNVIYSENYIKIEYFQGYRDSEMTHTYYNIGKKNLKKLKDIVNKYKKNISEIIEE